MIKLIGLGLAVFGVVIGLVGWFGFDNIGSAIAGALFLIIGLIALIKG